MHEPSATRSAGRRDHRAITVPGLFLGIGLGGFVDGIVLHQLLQWHHMRSGDGVLGDQSMRTVHGLETNTIADGLFHAAAWALTVTGLIWLWSIVRSNGAVRSWVELVGLLLAGWGLFNLVEGVVDHHLLGIHHVRDDIGAPLGWDLAFLASGAALVIAGTALARLRPLASHAPPPRAGA